MNLNYMNKNIASKPLWCFIKVNYLFYISSKQRLHEIYSIDSKFVFKRVLNSSYPEDTLCVPLFVNYIGRVLDQNSILLRQTLHPTWLPAQHEIG